MNHKDLLNSMPYPVARPASIAFGYYGDSAPQARVWDLAFAGYQVLRMATLPVLQAYFDDPLDTAEMPSKKAVDKIARNIESLRCPFYRDWIDLFNSLVKNLKPGTVKLSPVLPIAEIKKNLEQHKRPAFSDDYAPPGFRAPFLPHVNIYGLRNRLAHSGAPEDNRCKELLDHYLPVLGDLLECFGVLANCQLRVRDGRFNYEDTSVRILQGPEEPTVCYLGSDENWEDVLEEAPVGIKIPDRGVLPLWPLFGISQEKGIGLYDGHYLRRKIEQHVIYLGIGHRHWNDPQSVETLIGKMESRNVDWYIDKKKLAPWTIVDNVCWSSQTVLEELIDKKYFPRCYVERKDLQREWDRFFNGELGRPSSSGKKSYPNGWIMVGAAGTGKTAWTSHRAAELLRTDDITSRETQDLVLFLRGDMIRSSSDKHRLLSVLLERIGLRNKEYKSFADLLNHLGSRWSDDSAKNRRMVILLDAINEADRPEDLLNEALELISAASGHSWCRVVLTLRRELLDVLVMRKKTHGSMEKHPFFSAQNWLFMPGNPDLRYGQNEYLFELRPLTMGADGKADKAEQVYERYRTEGIDNQPGCLTPWNRLDIDTRRLLCTPIYLFLFHTTYKGKQAVRLRQERELMGNYVSSLFKEYSGLKEACGEVVSTILEREKPELSPEDANNLRKKWSESMSESERSMRFSPVEHLIHGGLLRRRTRDKGSGYVFVFETVFEYLIHLEWKQEDPELGLDTLIEKIRTGPSATQFAAYWNAFGFVLKTLLDSDREGEWPELINDSSPAALNTAAAEVWADEVLRCGLPSDSSHHVLQKTPPGRVVVILKAKFKKWSADRLRDLYSSLDRLQRPEWQAVVAEALGGIYYRLVESGRYELENELAMVDNNLGIAFYRQGKLDAAVKAYERARNLRLRLVESGRYELENELAMVDINLGVALAAQGKLDDAIKAYERARDIYYRLVESGRYELENYLAMVDLNLGTALTYQGKLDDAVKAFERARDIYYRLVTEEEHWHVLTYLCMTLYNYTDTVLNNSESFKTDERLKRIKVILLNTSQLTLLAKEKLGFNKLPPTWRTELVVLLKTVVKLPISQGDEKNISRWIQELEG